MTSNVPPVSRNRLPLVGPALPVVLLGLLLVTYALFKAPWPPDPTTLAGGRTVSHLERLRGKQVAPPIVTEQGYKTPLWYVRRMLDGAVYGLLIFGYVAAGLALWWDEPYMLAALAVVGLLGAAYGGSVGLYPGPILTLGGFSLVLFGSGFSWAGRGVARGEKQNYSANRTQIGADWTNNGTHSAT